jgi:hypothetical protein
MLFDLRTLLTDNRHLRDRECVVLKVNNSLMRPLRIPPHTFFCTRHFLFVEDFA